MHSTPFKVPGYATAVMIHNGDWSGDVFVRAWREARPSMRPNALYSSTPDVQVVVRPDGSMRGELSFIDGDVPTPTQLPPPEILWHAGLAAGLAKARSAVIAHAEGLS